MTTARRIDLFPRTQVYCAVRIWGSAVAGATCLGGIAERLHRILAWSGSTSQTARIWTLSGQRYSERSSALSFFYAASHADFALVRLDDLFRDVKAKACSSILLRRKKWFEDPLGVFAEYSVAIVRDHNIWTADESFRTRSRKVPVSDSASSALTIRLDIT
jgi:hypothetical protein